MSTTGPTLVHEQAVDLSLARVSALAVLINEAFPDPPCTRDERVRQFLALREKRAMALFTVWDRDVAIASAGISMREIGTERGPLRVMALAAVCSAVARRGEGWGRMVVQAAWGEVDRGRFPVALFQTSVPRFYDRLGARTVDNRFVNSGELDPRPGRGTREDPWWNPHIMIYPAAFDWPAGTIDLQGPGY